MDFEQQFTNSIIAESQIQSLQIENAKLRAENEFLKKKIFNFLNLNTSENYLDILKND